MAFQMTHMEVAYRLLKNWDWIKYDAEFIVASVAPDSVHMREDYNVDMKIRTHLFEGCGPWSVTEDHERWLRNIEAFWIKYGKYSMDQKTKSYAAGIVVHCLTDWCNDKYNWLYLRDKYVPPMDAEEFRKEYYPETRGMDQWLFLNSVNTKRLVELLTEGEELELDGFLRKEDILKQKDYMLREQYNIEAVDISAYKYMSEIFIEEFIKKTVSIIENWMKQKR